MGWASLWPRCDPKVMVPLVVDGIPFPAGIDRRLARLLRAVIPEACSRTNYHLQKPGCWGYACRNIENTNSPSNHSNGKAVDINAPSNGRGTNGNIPNGFVSLMESFGFEWGGRWAYTDPMHFEFKGTTQKASRLTKRAENQFGPARVAFVVGGKVLGKVEGAKRRLGGMLKSGHPGQQFNVRVIAKERAKQVRRKLKKKNRKKHR